MKGCSELLCAGTPAELSEVTGEESEYRPSCPAAAARLSTANICSSASPCEPGWCCVVVVGGATCATTTQRARDFSFSVPCTYHVISTMHLPCTYHAD